MCGIAGIIDFAKPPSGAAVEAMIGRLVHRGPDFGQAVLLDSCAVFGHRRLSIIDLSSNANQPMQDAAGRYTIVYNGELYNFRELKKELESAGVRFVSRSDTEVALYSYIQWGTRCFERFNGMFALAIWDGRERTCVLARDRLGKKPLYYYESGGRLLFASELTALREAVPAGRRKPSVEGLNHYLALGYICAPCTIDEDVRKLEPASFLCFTEKGIAARSRYWKLEEYFNDPMREPSQADCCAQLRALIDGSVRSRLVSDVPLGAFLSGGLDSSGIVACARRYAGEGFQTFTVGFSERSYDESADARKTARYLDTVHHDITVDVEHSPELIDRAIAVYDEPFSDTSLVPMVELAKLASRKIKVALSGDGADELFGGYVTYRADALKEGLDRFPFAVRSVLARLGGAAPVASRRKVSFGFRARQFAKGLTKDYRYAHYAWRELFDVEERIAMIGPSHEQEIRDTDPFRRFAAFYGKVAACDHLAQHQYVDIMTWLADDILVKLDRATMASSLEARCPYLDASIVEFAARIPPQFKLKNGSGKYILKEALRPYVPPWVLRKKKSGFNAPANVWLGAGGENEFRVFNRHVLKAKNLPWAIS